MSFPSSRQLLIARRIAVCAYCDKVILDEDATRDHILPRERGRIDGKREGIRNIRYACARCNQLRGLTAHCPAAMACVRYVSNDTKVPFASDREKELRLAIAWGFGDANRITKAQARAFLTGNTIRPRSPYGQGRNRKKRIRKQGCELPKVKLEEVWPRH